MVLAVLGVYHLIQSVKGADFVPSPRPHLVSAENADKPGYTMFGDPAEGGDPIERAVEWLAAHNYKISDGHQIIVVPLKEVRAGDLIEFDPGDKPIEWGIVFSASAGDHLGVDIGDSQVSVIIRVEKQQIKTVLRSVHVTPMI